MNPRIVTTPVGVPNISIWGVPETKFLSQFGYISYRDWCEKDAERIRDNFGQAVVVEWRDEKGSMVCIAKR
jgi:hypothetical protein